MDKNRVVILALVSLLSLVTACTSQTDDVRKAESYRIEGVQNPLIEQRADPWIFLHEDGFYYFTATVPEYDRIELRRSGSLQGLRDAAPEVIWRKHSSGEMGSHIWAPEIHFIEGKWYIYFAAGGAERIWDIRMYVLENSSSNPLEGEWVEKGRIESFAPTFSLDATSFEHRGKRYLVWAQKDPAIRGNTNLYIAELENPWTIKGKPVMLSRPEYAWEKHLYWVNEGPAVLVKNGKIFMTYSASGTDANYCMGMVTASAESDPLDPSSWEKSPEPVFKTSEETGIYGPGHSCFTIGEDGATDILVYHARSYKEIKGDPLDDPNRHTRVQKVLWKPDGSPDFGIPVGERNK